METDKRQQIITILKERSLTQRKIANLFNVGTDTITKIVRSENLYYGQGKRNFWTFSESIQTAYLIGIYLSDGSLIKTRKKNIRGVVVANTSPELIRATTECFSFFNLPSTQRIAQNSDKGKKKKYSLHCYSSELGEWLQQHCNGKNNIPEFIFHSSNTIKSNLIAGLIDGDGTVGKDGTIVIRNTNNWIFDLAKLLDDIPVKNSGITLDRILQTGKPYYRLLINRKEFLQIGGFCNIPMKQLRLLMQDREKYLCERCGQIAKLSKKATMCKKCANEVKSLLMFKKSKD